MQVEIVRHNNSTHDTHGLQQHIRIAVRAPGHKHSLENFSLIRGWYNVLKDMKNKLIMT